jgi:hypothetical protein
MVAARVTTHRATLVDRNDGRRTHPVSLAGLARGLIHGIVSLMQGGPVRGLPVPQLPLRGPRFDEYGHRIWWVIKEAHSLLPCRATKVTWARREPARRRESSRRRRWDPGVWRYG